MKLVFDDIIEINSKFVFYRSGEREPITRHNVRSLYDYLLNESKIHARFCEFLRLQWEYEREKMMRMHVPTRDEIESAELLRQIRMGQARDNWIEQRARVEMLDDMVHQLNCKTNMVCRGLEVIRNEWKL